jgi:hypothetical protein
MRERERKERETSGVYKLQKATNTGQMQWLTPVILAI